MRLKALTVVVVLVALAGCGGGPDRAVTERSTTTTEVASTATTTPSPAPIAGQDPGTFGVTVRQLIPTFTSYTDAELQRLAGIVCNGFTDGHSLEDVVQVGVDSLGVSVKDMAMFVGGAVEIYCPQFRPKFENH